MYGTLTRKLREVYSGRRRNHRPSKLRKLQDDIDDAVANSKTSSIISKKTDGDEAPSPPQSAAGHGHVDKVPPAPAACVCNGSEQPFENATSVDATLEQTLVDASEKAFPALPGSQDALKVLDEEPPVEAKDEQSARNAQYIAFEGEDETDCKKGPPRMVNASDGVEQCSSLLMTLDLSRKIQEAVRAQRRYASTARRAKRADDVDFYFEMQLQNRISDHEERLRVLYEDDQSAGSEHEVIEGELTKLRLLMENTGARRQCIAADLNNEADSWHTAQAEVNEYLEEAFVIARLLEPDNEDDVDEPVEELTVEGEYDKLCRQLQDSNGEEGGAIEPLHDFAEVLRELKTSPEDELRAKIIAEYWTARRNLGSAQADFDHRDADRARQRQENIDADARGEQAMDESPDAFDQRWLRRVRELTITLQQTEESMAAAKAKAREAGVEISTYDQASGFVDDVEDGYRVSHEEEIAASAPVPKITKWLSRVPSTVASPSFPLTAQSAATDEWEADEVGLSDSASVVAEGAERKRIDKWRETCGLPASERSTAPARSSV